MLELQGVKEDLNTVRQSHRRPTLDVDHAEEPPSVSVSSYLHQIGPVVSDFHELGSEAQLTVQ